ncbi:expressed unknown protein [Seminavis robusta]|uniref:LTD domain-containing protein n=1 Tax=Seminavis robusta TaxID=568900 RepID=A0A9N8DX75_9STRA|nr:expressed unknown protein [Seminavis robusta]|eukprot:Sro436_g142630.1 n/a (202) ;mRNA; r:32421-33026
MMTRKGNVAAILAALLSTTASVSAFTAIAPPAEAVVVPAQAQVPSSVISSSSNLPSQQELLSKSFASTINVAAATAAAPAPVAANTGSVVTISKINYNGEVPTSEADEYVVLTNNSKNAVDIAGYYVYVATTGTQGPTYTFPRDSVLKPGQSIRIYTNEVHKETGGYSFGSGKAIWNNKGGLAVLKNGSGTKLAEFKYKAS